MQAFFIGKMEKIFNKIKKSIAVLTATSLLISFVVGPTAASAINNEQTAKQYNQIFKEFILPYSYGKITKSHFAGTDRVIINIQDLHCHPKVQKNIANIIETFDKKYGINNIYLEGAYGDVSTQWIVDKISKDKSLLEKMMDTGRLTGAEYYSALSGKTEIIKGLEEKEPYLDNIVRLGSILNNQEKIDLILKALDESVNELKKKYYSKRQYKIEHLFKEYKDGKINSQKYYTLLSKHIDKLGIDLTKYENTLIYVTLLNSQKDLNYKQITKELQSLIAVLKQQLPYNAYKSLLENTSNFQEVEKLYSYIIQLDKVYNLDISLKFTELDKYFKYIELSKKINPVELVKEDEFLSQEINTRFSQTPAQKDVVFLVHFGRYLRDYVTTKITLEDYKYYKENIEQYRKIYNKYVDNRVLSLLDEYISQIDKFYEINMDRNLYFTRNMFENNEQFLKIEDVKQAVDDINKIISNMDEVKKVDVVVTGGFHSQTVTKLLEQQNVSYIVITPNVTDGIKLAEETYYELAKEQSKISFQTIAPVIASLSPQLQAVLLSKIESKNTEKIEQIMKMDEAERAQTIADLAAAKLLESDDLGNLKETLNEIVKNLVDEYHKEKVTPELVSKIKNLQRLLKDKEKLQTVIDLLNEGTAKQAVMVVSEIYDELYGQLFGVFVSLADKERLAPSERKDFDIDNGIEKYSEDEEYYEYDYYDELELWFSDDEIIELSRKIITEGQYTKDIEDFIWYLGKHNMADYELLNKILAELKSIKNSEIKKEYCGVLYALIDKDKNKSDEEKALKTKEKIMAFFEKPKLVQLKICEIFSIINIDYNDFIKEDFFDALLDVINKKGYEDRDFELLFEIIGESRFIAELGRENLYDFFNLSIEKRRLVYNFYKNSENNPDININQLSLNFILFALNKYNLNDEQFNYIMNLICSVDLSNDNTGKEYIGKLKEKEINLLVLEQFKYINEHNRYIVDLLFSDIDKKHIKIIISQLQDIINLFNDLQEYQIDTLETENRGLALSILSNYTFREYCKQNNITDIVKQYQLAIRVSRRMYAITGEKIFSLSSIKTDNIIKETLTYYENINKIISLLDLFTDKTAVFSLHNSERNNLDKGFRFTSTGIKELFKRLEIKPEVFETIEISFLDKISDFINATEQDEINKQTLLNFVNNLDGSIVLKKDMLDYISKQKNNMLSKRTLNRYIGRLKTTEPLVEANRFLKFIEHFNDYGQEKGVFIFDGHGLDDRFFYSDNAAVSVERISQALINAHKNGVNLENLTLMFSSCHSYKFSDNIINTLMEHGITEFPQIITDAGKETVYAYTKTFDADGKQIKTSNLFYSLFKFLESKTSEELQQMKGRLSFKDVADAPRYLSNNTILVTNREIDNLNRELEQTIRGIIGEELEVEDMSSVRAKGKYSAYAEMMLPVTKQILDFIGNLRIVKRIYKNNAGENFKFTRIGVILGAVIEVIPFFMPTFINAHGFDPSVKAGMIAVVWGVRALTIGIGIATGSAPIAVLSNIILHSVWNRFVISIGRKDLLLQTSKPEEITIPEQESKEEKGRDLSQEETAGYEQHLQKTILQNDIQYQYQPNPELKKNIEEIFGNLLDAMVAQGKITETQRQQYGIHYYYSPVANAYTVINSKDVFIFSELLYELSEQMHREGKELTKDHIAAILAHELQHTTQENKVYTGYRTVQGDNKRKEYDADRESIFILEQAGYNPRAVEEMMNALISLSRTNALAAFFDAHPNTEDRLKEISEILEDPSLVFLSMTMPQQPLNISSMQQYGQDFKKYLDANFDKGSSYSYSLKGDQLQKIFDETDFFEQMSIFDMSKDIDFYNSSTKDFIFNNILNGNYKFFTKGENDFIRNCGIEEKEFIYHLLFVSLKNSDIIKNLKDKQKTNLFDFCINVFEFEKIKYPDILFDMVATMNPTQATLKAFLDFRKNNGITISFYTEENAYFYLTNYKYLTRSEISSLLEKLIPYNDDFFRLDNDDWNDYNLSAIFESFSQEQKNESLKIILEILKENKDLPFMGKDPIGFINVVLNSDVLTKQEKFEYLLKLSKCIEKYKPLVCYQSLNLFDDLNSDKTDFEKLVHLFEVLNALENSYYLTDIYSYFELIDRYNVSEHDFDAEELKNFAFTIKNFTVKFDIFFLGYFLKLKNPEVKFYFSKPYDIYDKKYSDGVCLYPGMDVEKIDRKLLENITLDDLIEFQNFMMDNHYYCQSVSLLANFVADNILNLKATEKIKIKKLLTLLPKGKNNISITGNVSAIPYEHLKNLVDMQIFYKDTDEQSREVPKSETETSFIAFYVPLLEFRTFNPDYFAVSFEQMIEDIKKQFDAYDYLKELTEAEEKGEEPEIYYSEGAGDIGNPDVPEQRIRNMEIEKAWLFELHRIFNLTPEERNVEFSYDGENFVYTYFEINEQLFTDTNFVPTSQQAQELINAFSIIKKELPQETVDVYAKMVYLLLKRNPNLSVFSSAKNNLELLDLLFEDFSVVKDDYITELLDSYDVTVEEYMKIISKTRLYFFGLNSEDNNKNVSSMEMINTILPTLSDSEKTKFFFWLLSGNDSYKPQMLKQVKISNFKYEGEINFDSLQQSFRLMTKTERENFIRKILLGKSGILENGKANAERNSKEFEQGLKNVLFDDFFLSSLGSSKIKASSISIVFKEVFSIVFNNLSNERKVLFVNNLISALAEIKSSDENDTDEQKARQLGRLIVALGTSSGVAVVKLLQILSNNRVFEALDDKYGVIINEEVAKVKDENEPLSKSVLFQYLEKLGLSSDIEYVGKRLGSASIGITYLLKLKDMSELVVAKIKRPNINKNYSEDFQIADKILEYFKGDSSLLPSIYKKTLPASDKLKSLFDEELEFEKESGNLKAFNEQLKQRNSKIRVPQLIETINGIKVYTQNLFLQTTAKGTTLDKIKGSKKQRSRIYFEVLKEFFTEIFVDPIENGEALYHADLHTGNIFVDESGNISFIDLGGVGKVSAQQSKALKDIFMYLYSGKYSEFINALKSYNPKLYEDLEQDNSLKKIEEILNRKTSLESKFVDLFEVFNSLENIDSDFMMFIQAISKISGYLDNLDKQEQLSLLNNLNFDRGIQFKIILDNILTAIVSVFKKIHFGKKQKQEESREITQEDIFREKLLSNYPDMSPEDIDLLLSLDPFVLEYIKNNTFNLTQQRLKACGLLADRLYKEQKITEQNNKMNLLFKMFAITTFSEKNIEKLLTLDENTIEKIISEITEDEKIEILFAKAGQFNIKLVYKNDNFFSGNKDFERALMFAKGANLNKSQSLSFFLDADSEFIKARLLFEVLPSTIAKELLKDDYKLSSLYHIVKDTKLSLEDDVDLIEILSSFTELELRDIEFELRTLSDNKQNLKRFLYLYRDYRNVFQQKEGSTILSVFVTNNENDEQIREFFDLAIKNNSVGTIKSVAYADRSFDIKLSSEFGLELILFRSKALNIPIDENDKNFTDMLEALKNISSTGKERISNLDEDTYKKLLSLNSQDIFTELLKYISKYGYYDAREFEYLLNKAISSKNIEAEINFDENDYVTVLLIKKDDGTQYSVRLALTRIKSDETDYIRTGISDRKMVVYLSSAGENAFSKATTRYTTLEDIENLTGVKIEVSERKISAKSADSKADVRFVKNRDISQIVSSLQRIQIPAIDAQQKSDAENIANAEVTETVYLDESPEKILEKIERAVKNNSLIVIYPFSNTYDLDSLTDEQLYALYFDIQGKFFDLQESLEDILPKIDNQRAMSYVLKEFMKNAFVHGNLSNTSEPIYIKFIENGFSVINAKHTISDDKIKTNRLNLSAAATLTGAHRGLQIIQDYEKEGLIRVTPEEKRNVKAGEKEYFVITAVKTSGNEIKFNSLIERVFDKKEEIERINDSIQNNRDAAQRKAEKFLSETFTPEELEIIDLLASTIFDSIKYVNSVRNTSSIEFVNILYALQNGLFNSNLLPKHGEDLKQHILGMLIHYIEVSKQKKGEDNLLTRTVNGNENILNDIADYLVDIIEKNDLIEKSKTEQEKRKINMQQFIDGVKGDDKLFSAVMICSANENRSAIWHIMFKDFLDKHNKRNTKVFSAGVFYDISQRFMNENNTNGTKPLVEDYIETLKSDDRYKDINENLKTGFRSRYVEYLNLPKNSQPVFIVAGEQHRAQLIKLGYDSSWIFLMSDFYSDDFKKEFKQKNEVLGQQLEDNKVFSMSEFPDPFENQILRQDLPELVRSVVEYSFEGEAPQQQVPEEFINLTDDYNQFEHMEGLPDFSEGKNPRESMELEEGRQRAIQSFNEQLEDIASQKNQFIFRGNTKYLYLLQNKRNKYILLNIVSQPKIDLKFRLFALLYLDRLSYDLTSEERADIDRYKAAITKKLKKQIENNEFTVQNNLDLRAYMMGVYLLLENYSYRAQVPRRLIDRAIIINGDEKTMGRDDGLFAEVDLFIVVHELTHVMLRKPKLFNTAAADALDEMVSYITPNIFLRKIANLSFNAYSARQKRYVISETNGVIDYVKMGRKFHSLYSLFDEKVSEQNIEQEVHSAPIAFLDYLFKTHELIGKSVDWDVLLEAIEEIDDSTLRQHSMFKTVLNSYLKISTNKGLLTTEETETVKKEMEKMQLWTLLIREIMEIIEKGAPEVNYFLSRDGISKDNILSKTNKLKEKEIFEKILKAYGTKFQLSKNDLVLMFIIDILKDVEYEQLENNFDGVISGIIDAVNNAAAEKNFDLQQRNYTVQDYMKMSPFVKNNFVITENKGMSVTDNIFAYIAKSLGQVLFVEPLINQIFGKKDLSSVLSNRRLLVTSSTEQTDMLNKILSDNNIEDTTVVTMEVVASPVTDIRDGIYLDVAKGIKAKYEKSNNTITVYSKKGITANTEEIQELIMQQYFSERYEDSFDDVIAFAGINDSSLQDITDRLKTAYTDSVSMPNKDTNFDLSSRTIKDLATMCKQEFVSTGIKTFIITSDQLRNFADDIKSLQEQDFKFIISCKVDEITDITNYDGLIIDASSAEYTDISQAINVMVSVKKNILKQGVGKQVSVKFANDTYQQFNNEGINIFDTYGIVPIVVNSYMVNSIIGKCAVEKITEDSIDRLIRQNNIIGLVIDDARIFSDRKNRLKETNTKEHKYNKGYNASLNSKFDYVCSDVTKLKDILSIDINSEEQLEILQNIDLETLNLSADSLTYLNYLKSKGRYEEMLGFIRGIAMNSARAQIIKGLKNKEINLDMDKFAKEAGGKYQKAFLTVAVQLMMDDIDITELLETDFINSDMTVKEYLDSVLEKVNINIEDILKQNEFKIEKSKDTAKTIEDFKNYVVLLDNLKIIKETTANFDMSMKAVRSMLSAA